VFDVTTVCRSSAPTTCARTRPKRMRPVAACLLIAACVAMTGCTNQGILLTPVSLNQELKETTVLSDGGLLLDKIALIDVSGVIRNERGNKLLGSGEHPVSLLREQLDEAARDRSVKAVILRINSPGGTVAASELMHAELMHFRRHTNKPVIAVMMDVAASGGYYLACGCDEIFAHASTVTGSIGVIMLMVDVSGTMHKIGVQTDAITSGPMKDAGSPFRTMTDDERALFQAIVDEFYDSFVATVAAGRPRLDEDQIRRLADGRVYTGAQALEVGLVDRLGTIRDAARRAKELAHLEKARVIMYRRPLDYRPNIYAQTPTTPGGDVNLINIDASSLEVFPTPQFLYLWQPGL
jgi:protease-4